MTEPKPKLRIIRVVNAGKKFEPKVDKKTTKVVPYYNKFERRIVRARTLAKQGRIGNALAECREADLEVAQLATNSHERQRAIAKDRKQR